MASWQIIVSSIGGSVVLTTILGFLLREWVSTRIRKSIEHEYATKLARMKAELDGKLEGMRAAYRKILDENQIRFSQFHSDRADATKTLYQRIADMEAAVGAVVALHQHGDEDVRTERKKAAAQAAEELLNFFSRSRIFFSKSDCDLIEKLHGTAQESFVNYTTYDNVPVMENNDRSDQRERQYKAWQTMQGDFQDVRKSLETQFRRALGFTGDDEARGES